jgi:hypothetical protein
MRKENKMYYILKQGWDKSVSTTYMADKGYATIEEANEKVEALRTLNDNEDNKYFIVERLVA